MSAPTRTRPLSAEEYVAELVAAAPPPTAEQIATLRRLVGSPLAEAARTRRSRTSTDGADRRAA